MLCEKPKDPSGSMVSHPRLILAGKASHLRQCLAAQSASQFPCLLNEQLVMHPIIRP